MPMNFNWNDLLTLIGISGIVSAVVAFVLERWKFSKEKQIEAEKERLEYSFLHYPNFCQALLDAIKASREARNLLPRAGESEKSKAAILTVLYRMGGLYLFERKFRSDQGQLFRLASHDSEILARFLYDLGKECMGMTSSRLGLSSSRLNMYEELYLVQMVEEAESLVDFVKIAQKDEVLGKLSEQIARGVIPSRAQEWAEKDLGTLSRFLIKEVQSIRLPGYSRDPIPLSFPDQNFIQAVKKIATVFVSRSSLNSFDTPLKIWVYNHWAEEISLGSDTPHFRVSRQETESCMQGSKVIDLDILDPVRREKKSRLNAGETGMVLWDRCASDGQSFAGDGWYQLIYLPETEDLTWGTTSAYSVDYFMDRENDFQSWQLRSSLQ